jgi:hypothetical protein
VVQKNGTMQVTVMVAVAAVAKHTTERLAELADHLFLMLIVD